jgi:hypothetical protein
MSPLQVFAQKGDGVSPKGQPDMAVILDHLAARRHWAERNNGFMNLGHKRILAGGSGCEQRERLVAQCLDRPQRFAPGKFQGGLEGIGLRKLDKRGGRHPGASPEIVNRDERLIRPRADDRCGTFVGKTLDHVYASRTRFIPAALMPHFECVAWPLAAANAGRQSTRDVRVDVGAKMRSMWR